MLTWYDRIFPPLMILLPLLMVLFTRWGETTPERRARARRLTGWLVLGTIAAEVVWLVAYLWVFGDHARHLWSLAAPLFPLAMRIMPLRNADTEPPHLDAPVRAASLTSRAHASPIPRAAWVVPWLIAGVAIAAIALRRLQPFDGAEEQRWWMALLMALFLLPMEALIGPWALRLVLREPEPLDASGSEALREAYRRHRNQRAWGLYGLISVLALMVGAGMVAIAWIDPAGPLEQQLGWWGGGVGCAIGMAGAAFGVWSGIGRARINGLVRESMRTDTEAAG
ncbi:MAG: hypothetical protein KDA21_06250 [Phycisphaerales bacterium]|nr:hypothetical protein [Phycisphaerales bacterium]